ncbi:hypothetical protein KPH14_001636 [Odynerus spinipes]|uniref:BTB domain-containing protein n=1 Tax=Odynerus spinipes TaxID=1348599 RepID=A0AAD9VWN3_9HYME|nr:hypothetical protein KPH14_001636 [Odynerus spinipes]
MGDELITLIFEKNRFEVDKKKLISKSRYFECLLSHNFSDSQNKEHVINYDITISTLQNFIKWVHDTEHVVIENSYSIKSSMIKYEKDNFADLLNLLQLSTLFMVDDLINDITDIIVLNWLHPEQIIDVWLLTQELGINVLRDICFAVCLDRFIHLPIRSLIKLPVNNLRQLLENVNVRSPEKYLHSVLSMWVEHNVDRSVIDICNINRSKTEKSTILHYMVGYKTENSGSKKGYICLWDGVRLSEVTELKDVKNSGKEIVGMQVTGRGFSIYIIGGEYGLGTGQFNMIIWRYCLISKKWYYFARLPSPRRHMVVAFLGNCLIAIGGVGRHRLKLSSVDMLNIHTGKWSKIANVPECFTEVPPYCVIKKKLFLLKSSLHIYCPETDLWKTVMLSSVGLALEESDIRMEHGITIFGLKDSDTTENDETVLTRISNTQKRICNECLKLYTDSPMVHTMGVPYVGVFGIDMFVSGIGVIFILRKHCESCNNEYLQLDNEVENDKQELTLVPRVGSCYTIDPKTLYN